MAEKKLKASIVIGGLIDGSLRSALTETRAGFRQLGDALKSATQAQRGWTANAVHLAQVTGRNVWDLAQKYDHLAASIQKAKTATEKLKEAESFKYRLDRRAGIMRADAGRAAAGAAIGGALLGSTIQEASATQVEETRLKIMGVPDEAKQEALKAGRELKNFGTTIRENMEAYNDGLAVFGNMHEARMAAPIMAKMKFANGTLFGTSEEESERQNKDMLRVIDLRGGATDSKEFANQADYIQRAVVASKGLVNGSEFFKMVQHGGTAVKGMSNDALYAHMLPLIQEMHGDQLGTALQTAYNSLVQGHTSKRAAINLQQAGLIADKSKVKFDKNGMAAQINPGALKGSDLYARDPTQWVKSIMLPALVQSGKISNDVMQHALTGKLTETEKGLLNTITASLGNTNTGKLLSTIATSLPQIDRDSKNVEKSQGIDGSAKAARNTARGQTTGLHAQVTDLRLNLGEAVLPLYVSMLGKVNAGLTTLNGFVREHPKLTRVMMVGAAGLTVAMAASVPVLMAAGLALQAYGGYAALAARREAFLTAAQLRQTTVTVAEASAEKAATLTRATGWRGLFGTVRGGVGRVMGSLTRLPGAARSLFSVGTLLGGLTTVAEGLGAAFVALTGPIGVGMAALAAGAFLVWRYWQPLKAFFGGFGQGIATAFSPLLSTLRPIFTAISNGAQTAWRWLTSLLTPVQATASGLTGAASAGQRFGAVVGGAFQKIGPALGEVWGAVRSVASLFWNLMRWDGRVIGAGLSFIAGVARGVFPTIAQGVGAGVQLIGTALGSIWTTVRPAFSALSSLAQTVEEGFSRLLNPLHDSTSGLAEASVAGQKFWTLVSGAMKLVGAEFGVIWSGLRPVVSIFWTLTKWNGRILGAELAFIGGIAKGLLPTVARGLRGGLTLLTQGISTGVGMVITGASHLWQAVRPVFTTLSSIAQTAWSWLTRLLIPVQATTSGLTGASEAGERFGAIVGNALSGIWTTLRPVTSLFWNLAKWDGRIIGAELSFIAGVARGVFPVIAQSVSGAFSLLTRSISAGLQFVGSALGSIWQLALPFIGLLGRMGSMAGRALGTAFQAVAQTVTPIFGKISAAIESLQQALGNAGQAGVAFGQLLGKVLVWLTEKIGSFLGSLGKIGGLLGGLGKSAFGWMGLGEKDGKKPSDPSSAGSSTLSSGALGGEKQPSIFPPSDPQTSAPPTNPMPDWLAAKNPAPVNVPALKDPRPQVKAGDVHNKISIKITQQPGESPDTLANTLVRRLQEKMKPVPLSDGAD